MTWPAPDPGDRMWPWKADLFMYPVASDRPVALTILVAQEGWRLEWRKVGEA